MPYNMDINKSILQDINIIESVYLNDNEVIIGVKVDIDDTGIILLGNTTSFEGDEIEFAITTLGFEPQLHYNKIVLN